MKNDPMFSPNFRRNMSDLRDAISNLVQDTIADSWQAVEGLHIPERMSAFADYGHEEDDYFDEDFPKIDIRDTGDALRLSADLPGVDPDDIEIEVGDDMVSLAGIAGYEFEEEDEEHHFYNLERYYGTFERLIPLPDLIDADAAVGEIKNGTLVLTLPKLGMEEIFEFDDMDMEEAKEKPSKKKAPAKSKKKAASKPKPKAKATKKAAPKKKTTPKKKK